MTDEEIAMLAQLERDMDAGKKAFVINRGGRWAFPDNVLSNVGVVSGQTVCDTVLTELLKRNLADIETLIAIRKAGEQP